MKCIVLKAVVMISYIMKSKIRWPKASSARRSSSSPASYSSRWVEVAVEAAALRKWRRESFESFEHRGRSAPPLRCLLEEEWGNPERWLGGETPHITWGRGGVSCSWRGRAACLASKGEILEARCDGE